MSTNFLFAGFMLFAVLGSIFLVRTLKVPTDRERKKLAGVCAGLSKVSDMPIWIIRAFFIVFILFYGFGLILYVILCLAMPKAEE